ncbi:MAG: hypothetical protein HOW73_48665 [Polyangiaceae bacterium]|nr:hypothetical protein [Polyangiaceae bacterium]
MEIELRSPFPDDEVERIRSFVEPQGTLHDVVVAGLASTPERIVCKVVVQDEYTHDVVVRWSQGIYLVYDTT